MVDNAFARTFRWSCCEGALPVIGCVKSTHVPVVPSKHISQVIHEGQGTAGSVPNPALKDAGSKRKRIERCRHCEEDYDVEGDKYERCSYHQCKLLGLSHPGSSPDQHWTGTKVVDNDSSTWEDHDERCHGLVETLVNDPTYADGFMWSFCDAPLEEDGCVPCSHEPAIHVSSKKRARR